MGNNAAIELPVELGEVPGPDHDALRFLLIASPDATLAALDVVTLNTQGRPLDAIVNFHSQPATCPDGVAPELVCRQTSPLRLVGDVLDRERRDRSVGRLGERTDRHDEEDPPPAR